MRILMQGMVIETRMITTTAAAATTIAPKGVRTIKHNRRGIVYDKARPMDSMHHLMDRAHFQEHERIWSRDHRAKRISTAISCKAGGNPEEGCRQALFKRAKTGTETVDHASSIHASTEGSATL